MFFLPEIDPVYRRIRLQHINKEKGTYAHTKE